MSQEQDGQWIGAETTEDCSAADFTQQCRCNLMGVAIGKTAEQGEWDEQFVTYKIAARPRLKDNAVRFRISGTAELEAIPEPNAASGT